MEATEQFLQWVEEPGNIVFFGGAGVSTESGICLLYTSDAADEL